jgi:hypothetical protein
MRSKILGKLSLMFIFAMLLIPTGVANGETLEVNDGNPYIEVYDAKGNLVKSYSDEEIEALMEEAKESNLFLEPEVIDGTPYAHTYDENGILIDSTVEGAVEAQQSAIAEAAASGYSTYNYSATTFNNNVWVAQGSTFYNPADITINPQQKFEGMLIKLFKSGTETGKIKIGNFVGGIHVPLTGLWNGSGQYQVQFVNANTNGATIYLNGGTLYYN